MEQSPKHGSTRPIGCVSSKRFGLVAAIMLTLAACSSHPIRPTQPTYPTGSLTAEYMTTLDLRTACTFMTQRRLLKRAGDLLTGPVDARELNDVILYMQDVSGVGSPKIQLATQNIVDGLTSIKDGRPDAILSRRGRYGCREVTSTRPLTFSTAPSSTQGSDQTRQKFLTSIHIG